MTEETTVLENERSHEAIPETAAPHLCPHCGKELAEDQKFCPGCGHEYAAPVPASAVFCTNCGAEVPQGNAFCANCGTKTGAAATETPSPAAPAKKSRRLSLLIGIGAAVIAIAVILVCTIFRKIPVEDITVDKSTVEIKQEESINISCELHPENASDKTVIWTSSDDKIATVDSFGRITGISNGECVITAKAGDAEEGIKVVVKKKLPDLKAIYDELCKSTWADLGDDHSYISVDTNPYNKDDGDYRYMIVANDAIEAINKKLGLPDSLYDDMNSTTWSMGKQEEVFENIGIRVNWTYHPDKGLEVSYKLILS